MIGSGAHYYIPHKPRMDTRYRISGRRRFRLRFEGAKVTVDDQEVVKFPAVAFYHKRGSAFS